MDKINIHAAKTHLSKLIERAATGEEIILAKAGKPMAILGPFRQKNPQRAPGALGGKITISPEFDS